MHPIPKRGQPGDGVTFSLGNHGYTRWKTLPGYQKLLNNLTWRYGWVSHFNDYIIDGKDYRIDEILYYVLDNGRILMRPLENLDEAGHKNFFQIPETCQNSTDWITCVQIHRTYSEEFLKKNIFETWKQIKIEV